MENTSILGFLVSSALSLRLPSWSHQVTGLKHAYCVCGRAHSNFFLISRLQMFYIMGQRPRKVSYLLVFMYNIHTKEDIVFKSM